MVNYKSLIRKPYYYVPPCPSCNSRMTGRFVRLHREVETEWMIDEALRNGELIDPQPDLPHDNAFCVECGYTWMEDIPVKFLSLSQIAEEKAARHTSTILKGRYERHKEFRRQNRKSGIIGMITRFVGKL